MFPSKTWADFEKDWVVVELDFPRGKRPAKAVQLSRAMGVKGLPTMVVLDPEGSEIGRVVGGARTPAVYVDRVGVAAGLPSTGASEGLPLPVYVGAVVLLLLVLASLRKTGVEKI